MNDSLTNALSLASKSLAAYATAVYPTFECSEHIRVIVEALEDVERGKTKRLVVVLPPRHGKSLLCSQIFPAWYLGRNPEKSVVCTSYGESLVADFGRAVRGFLTDPAHQAIFPRCRLSADVAAQNRLATIRGGFYFGMGRGGPITGRGCELLIVDDLTKDFEEAHSETIRKSTWAWLQHVGLTRLSPGGCIVMVGTRWHPEDAIGKLLDEVSGCRFIHLGAISERDERFREAGEALWPSKFPLEVLRGIRASIGERAWTSLYQGKPSAAEGSIFKRDWLRYYSSPPEKFERLIQSWDVAAKTGAANDYSVCTTWGAGPSGYYLLGLWRGKVEFPELKRRFGELAEMWGPDGVLIEDSSAGIPLTQELKLATNYPVIPIRASRSKELRAQSCTPVFEGARVFLPEGAPWLSDFTDELVSFPSSAHDDMVDSTCQALNYLRDRGMVLGVVEWIKGIMGGSIPHPDAAPPPQPEPTPVVTQKLAVKPPDVKPACPVCRSNQFVIACSGGYHCNSCSRSFFREGQGPMVLRAGFRGGIATIFEERLR